MDKGLIMQEKIGNIILELSKYPGEDLYSDGAVEDVLLDIAKNEDNKDYATAIDEAKDWPVLYHYSKQRENIVSWLPITKEHKVLEIGSGCGAITGALSKMAKSVTCVDLSKKRSMVNAWRHKDADNVTIHVGNFLDIEPELPSDFDYICLIGVFEYGQSYMGCEKPFHKFLDIIRKHVKNDGRIVIAIENKLGMKYFAGCREDHLGTYFSGIEGYPEGGYVRTFSRNTLEKIFKECGQEEYHFYYPYPDYKFPTTIFSDKRLPLKGELSNNIRNFDRERLLLFNEMNAFDSIIEDGLFPVFSNSYVAILGKDIDLSFARFSNERADEYSIVTYMDCDDKGNIRVCKKAENSKGYEHIRSMKKTSDALKEKYAGSRLNICGCQIIEDNDGPVASFDYIEGKTLTELLDERIGAGDTEGFKALIREFRARIDYNNDADINDLDLVFSNVIIKDDTWTVIDYEWTSDEDFDPNYQTFRALYCYRQENETRQKPDYKDIYDEIGVGTKEEEEYIEKEVLFHKKVQDSHYSLAQMREEIGNSIVHPEKYLGTNAKQEKAERVQIYTDRGSGYSEDNSYFVKKAKFENDVITFDIHFDNEVKNLRIDPMMCPGAVFIDSFKINGSEITDFSKKVLECNGRKLRGDIVGYVFETDDPNMNLHLEGMKLEKENLLEVRLSYACMNERTAHGVLSAAKKLI